jgi:hypothetical protein
MSSVNFPVNLGGDGSTVTDDSNATTGLGNGGFRTRLLPMLSQVIAVANWMLGQVIAAATSATNAATSAASALNAPGTNATSATNTAVALGNVTVTVQSGKAFVVGQTVMLARTSAPATTWMYGQITAHNAGTGSLTIAVSKVLGAGTFSDWTVSLSGPITDPSITFKDLGNSGAAAQTLDYNVATSWKITTTGNFTLNAANWPGASSNSEAMMKLSLVNGAAFTVTLGFTVNWVNPDGTTTTTLATYLSNLTGRSALKSAGTDQMLFWSYDGGTTIFGRLI